VVELQLFGSAYHFDRAGFVKTESHFDWATTAMEKLGDFPKDSTIPIRAGRRQGPAWPVPSS